LALNYTGGVTQPQAPELPQGDPKVVAAIF
jgi:hypothetical protein